MTMTKTKTPKGFWRTAFSRCKHTIYAILLLLLPFSTTISAKKPQKPKGNLIYCSYSITRNAGLGIDYCELINENGSIDIVVVRDEDSRFDQETRLTFKATAADVAAISKTLKSLKAWRLQDSPRGEEAPGSVRFRVYMEYDSGEKIGSVWFGVGTKEQQSVFYALQAFFNSRTTSNE